MLDFVRLTWRELEPGRRLVEGRVLEVMCEHLEAVARGEIKRLIINVPPGLSKSMLTSVFLPAWLWGPINRPWERIISTSYAQELAIRDNLRARQLIQSESYQEMWGGRFSFSGDQNQKSRYENSARGFRQVSSVGSALTGHRGDLIIIDDPHSVKSAESDTEREAALFWLTETLPTRVNDPETARMVIIMQRLHERDVSGHLLEHNPSWEHLCLPMEYEPDHPHQSRTSLGFQDWRTEPGELLFPERFSRKSVDELKADLRTHGGSYAEAGQLQQRPAPRGGGMFPRDRFQFTDHAPAKVRARVRGWDLAATSKGGAFTAGVRMSMDSDGRVFVEDMRRLQGSGIEVERAMIACAQADPPGTIIDIPQDPGQAGKSQVAHLRRKLHGYVVHSSPETGDKSVRAAPLASQVEGENVWLVRGPWNDAFIAETAMFPAGALKDQVDASSRSYARLIRGRASSAPVGPQIISLKGDR